MSHVEKEYSLIAIALNLTVACLVSGLVIATVFTLTKDTAEKNRILMKNKAMKKLIQTAEQFKEIEGKPDWYQAESAGKVVGYVLPAEGKGYGGKLKLLVAIDTDRNVISFKLLSPIYETPGLGDNADKDKFKGQFRGKSIENLKVTKDPENKDDIQAMTGATITSRGVTGGVHKAVEELTTYLEAK